jgi:hypothetical protein
MKQAAGTVEEGRTKLSGRSEDRVLRGWLVGKTGLIVVSGCSAVLCCAVLCCTYTADTGVLR